MSIVAKVERLAGRALLLFLGTVALIKVADRASYEMERMAKNGRRG